ncbi:hypothetical protein BRADI_5g26326v3 [Brachypodium distachyon]|uniref:Uncharacterized protein n=1 Tax=Brachypodium distachyon TaxID=15368 RepID=A0A2K2CJE8_BRADI|nr:hypothetical protein BRADI_5g26326v3 [Brachypodium distachyon]
MNRIPDKEHFVSGLKSPQDYFCTSLKQDWPVVVAQIDMPTYGGNKPKKEKKRHAYIQLMEHRNQLPSGLGA